MTKDLSHAPGDALTVLVIDDDAGDRKQIVRALKQTGLPCECVEATGVDLALAACEQRSFDLAIVDYRLPNRDGLDGVAALHQKAPDMFIIMATGQGDATVATEAMKCGASDYIAKQNIHEQSIGRIILAPTPQDNPQEASFTETRLSPAAAKMNITTKTRRRSSPDNLHRLRLGLPDR